MRDYNDLLAESTRSGQMSYLPNSIVNSKLFSNAIFNTVVTSGTFSINNNTSTTITSSTTSSPDKNAIIAAVPYQIALFQTSASTSNLIPQVNPGSWRIDGPFGMPFITPYYDSVTTPTGVGNNGKNLVFKTTVYNTTGSTQVVVYYIGLRILSFATAAA